MQPITDIHLAWGSLTWENGLGRRDFSPAFPRLRMRRLQLFDEAQYVLVGAADEAPAPHLRVVRGCNAKSDGVVMDIQPDVLDKVHVSVVLSLLSLTDQQGGSALRLVPARNPRSRKADTSPSPIASHSD